MLRGNTIGKEETRAGNLFASDIAESRGSDVKIGYAIDVKHLRGSRKSELGRGGWRIPVTLNPLKATTKTGCATNIGKNVVRTENWAADDTFRKLEILQENRDRRNKNWSATNNGEKRKIEIWPYNTPDPRNSFYPNFLKKKICTLINDTTNFQILNPHQKPILIKHKINLSNLRWKKHPSFIVSIQGIVIRPSRFGYKIYAARIRGDSETSLSLSLSR